MKLNFRQPFKFQFSLNISVSSALFRKDYGTEDSARSLYANSSRKLPLLPLEIEITDSIFFSSPNYCIMSYYARLGRINHVDSTATVIKTRITFQDKNSFMHIHYLCTNQYTMIYIIKLFKPNASKTHIYFFYTQANIFCLK